MPKVTNDPTKPRNEKEELALIQLVETDDTYAKIAYDMGVTYGRVQTMGKAVREIRSRKTQEPVTPVPTPGVHTTPPRSVVSRMSALAPVVPSSPVIVETLPSAVPDPVKDISPVVPTRDLDLPPVPSNDKDLWESIQSAAHAIREEVYVSVPPSNPDLSILSNVCMSLGQEHIDIEGARKQINQLLDLLKVAGKTTMSFEMHIK